MLIQYTIDTASFVDDTRGNEQFSSIVCGHSIIALGKRQSFSQSDCASMADGCATERGDWLSGVVPQKH